MLWQAGGGLGGIALSQMEALAAGGTHFPPKAKNIILIFLPGGPWLPNMLKVATWSSLFLLTSRHSRKDRAQLVSVRAL